MQRLVYIILLFVLFLPAMGQERNDFSYFDSLTYKQYTEEQWKELSKSGKKALSLGYDYYYMRMRIGISLYEKQKYLSAIKHFRKALEYNNGDQIASEYLYYCYLFGGNYYTANAVKSMFTQSTLKKTGIRLNEQNRMSIDFLYNGSSSDEIINKFVDDNDLPDPGKLIIPVSYLYSGLTLTNNPRTGIFIKHSVSLLRRENSLFTEDGNVIYPDYRQKVNQFQYFLSAKFSKVGGFSITPSVFLMHSTYPLIEFGTNGMQTYAYSFKVNENNIGSGLDLSVSSGLVRLSADAYASHISYRNHFQAGLNMIIYPLANKKLYFGLGYNLKSSEINVGYSNNYVVEAQTGLSFNNRLFIDLSVLSGDIRNFIENENHIVYSGINSIDRIVKVDLSVPIGTKGGVIYLGTRHISESTAFIPEDFLYSTQSYKNFNSLSIIGGLSWTF